VRDQGWRAGGLWAFDTRWKSQCVLLLWAVKS